TLLFRAPEIKQEKRRQTLIEHAEAARISKKLVTLDDHVKLEMPIGDLAVHEPDYKRLIAFLKAMEFNGLMRRVAEFASVDPGAIDAAARLASQTGAKADAFPPQLAGEDDAAEAEEAGAPPRPETPPLRAGRSSAAELSLPLTGGGMAPRPAPVSDRSG